MQAHLLGPREFWHFVISYKLQLPGQQSIVDGVEHDQAVGPLKKTNEVEPLGAAIENGDVSSTA
ncbi:hypothetical protein ABIF65_010332 [Bradyrhizobium japonicum]|jgi:hypothetical protein|uniref:Uncharacterized protein n=1 Tax=Bradyrhizobium diazoefficiens TaxID=1355477 RepID=A0A810B7V4_9BRAD|nr:hypothetical protein [Bradyrhizobium japonicum]BBO08364.1 hypothetical protein SG09_77140 [Bradyrhizobium ottawaense]BBZ91983.1 hypothetical protein F07S3_18160 [Bradyrhizobium diazoefficiens]MCP1783451.1 hypothetical protein [Bradyrhizobium japonicum]MCP1855491.1 hypothetical protein [Bradyrhizobium japonicum]